MPIGTVRGLAQFLDGGLERMEIWIDKKHADSLPYIDNERVKVMLKIKGRCYNAGLRSTFKNKYVWICPDIRDNHDQRIDSLAHVLTTDGFYKNQTVDLIVDGNIIEISPVKRIKKGDCSIKS